MALRIRDWNEFQHFKDRSPPWIKLYRNHLDDPDWHALDGESAKVLVMLWLVASEDETKEGLLPDLRKLAFRSRMSEAKLTNCITKLSHWLIQDDINAISSCRHDDAPETETETYNKEAEREAEADRIRACAEFWEIYPRKDGSKAKAMEVLNKILKEGIDYGQIISGVEAYREKCIEEGTEQRYIAHATTWLNQRRWEADYTFERQRIAKQPKGKGELAANTSAKDSLNTSPIARSEEIADMVSVCFKALNTYGKTPDQMHATIKLFCMVLEGQPVDQVRAAFRQWVTRESNFPTPVDIMNIINPPVEEWKPDWSVFNALKKRIQNDGYYPLSDERQFLRRCEEWTYRRAAGDDPAEQEARRLMFPSQDAYG